MRAVIRDAARIQAGHCLGGRSAFPGTSKWSTQPTANPRHFIAAHLTGRGEFPEFRAVRKPVPPDQAGVKEVKP